MKYKLIFTNNWGHIVDVNTGQVILSPKGSPEPDSFYLYFVSQEPARDYAKVWLNKNPSCFCTLLLGEEEITIYSYESFYQS